jgi:hypothetical protein
MTKVTTLFVFDRVTGDPIYGIEERGGAEEHRARRGLLATQPFPVKPEPLGRTTFDPAKDFYGLTPDHAAFCKGPLGQERDVHARAVHTSGLEGYAVTFPSTLGGGNWNGLSHDPGRGLVFTNLMNLGQVARMVEGVPRGGGERTWMRTTPWGGVVGRFWNPENKIPCSAPPFGELVAVDVDRGAVVWRVPLGFIETLKAQGFPGTGALNIGGTIATASGLLFVGATNDRRFRAFDSATGAQLWETELEASAHSIPMTFLGRDGRQYVVVAAGGGSYLNSAPGRRSSAFALRAPRASPRLVRPAAPPRSAPAPPRASASSPGPTCGMGTSTTRSPTRCATIEQAGTAVRALRHVHPHRLAAHHEARRSRSAGTGIATGESFLARNLDYFDAIFFFGVREIDLTAEQRADLLSFVKDDGKGFVAAHSAITASSPGRSSAR